VLSVHLEGAAGKLADAMPDWASLAVSVNEPTGLLPLKKTAVPSVATFGPLAVNANAGGVASTLMSPLVYVAMFPTRSETAYRYR
jgi:hypothetical protein